MPSKAYPLGGRSRDLDESARVALYASSSGRCFRETCSTLPQRSSFWV